MFSLILSFLFLFFNTPATISVMPVGQDVTVSWDANTETDLAGYKIYYGQTSRGNVQFAGYSNLRDVGDVTSYVISNMDPGRWYFSVTAYDLTGNESLYSLEVSALIDSVPDIPIPKKLLRPENFTMASSQTDGDTVVVQSSKALAIGWYQPAQFEDSTYVYLDNSNVSWNIYIQNLNTMGDDATWVKWNDNPLTANFDYSFSIAAGTYRLSVTAVYDGLESRGTKPEWFRFESPTQFQGIIVSGTIKILLK